MINEEAFAKSLASYKAAFDKIFEISRIVDIAGSGHTIMSPMMGNVRASQCDFRVFASHATAIKTSHRDLFDFTRPKPIETGYHEWRGYFFSVQFIVQVPYDLYQWRPVEISLGGPLREAHLESDRYFLCLEGPSRNFGVEKWEKQRAERESLADTASDSLQAEYMRACAFADAEVVKWLTAVNERPKVSLAV